MEVLTEETRFRLGVMASQYVITVSLHQLANLARRKVLLLGAGFVTKPTVQILSDANIEVTVGSSYCSYLQLYSINMREACRTLSSAKKLCQGLRNTRSIVSASIG